MICPILYQYDGNSLYTACIIEVQPILEQKALMLQIKREKKETLSIKFYTVEYVAWCHKAKMYIEAGF